MPTLKIDTENTLKEAMRSPLNLFLGAGFSVYAKNASDNFLPTGNALRDSLLKEFHLDQSLKTLTLPKLCTIIESSQHDALEQYFRSTFEVVTFDPKYSLLVDLPLSSIFTTNIDNLIPQIFKNGDKRYLNDIVKSGPAFADKTAIDYVALHGSIVHDEGFTFNPLKIASAFNSDRDRWHFLTQRLQQSPTIFIGYGVEDAGVLEALNPLTVAGREHRPKWILLRNPDKAAETYYRAMGFELIVGDVLDLIVWLHKNIPLALKSPQNQSVNRHPAVVDYLIPNPNSMPVRPIRDFYSGSGATWDDIFSRRIFRTSHFKALIDRILGKENIIALGMVAAGKTTLMMQVAAELRFSGVKLACLSITLERAELLVRALNGTRAIIFIDDFSDSVDSFTFLSSQANIQVIGFERNYAFDAISHLVDPKSFKIYECTDLTDSDIQGLYKSIPIELKKHKLVKPPISHGLPPSLFEIIESNVVQPHVLERFKSVLKDLESKSAVEHDFLVFCCYVHECRTRVSFDMALAFLRRDISGYADVYSIVEKLNTLVIASYDLTVDHEEDFFVPRSSIMSHAVMEKVRSEAFRRVLERFQDEVSRFRIVRFDVFRRRAFDEQFATKAFPQWEDGQKYYEMLVAKDDSPFLYQQAALYLSKKRRYREAFRWIDQAVEMSGGRIASIRNTHAMILFDANIGSVDSGSTIVADTLKRSMDILSECYRYDKRKNYHAIKFAEQALKYWQAYGNTTAIEYLVTARKWLEEESVKSPWNRRITQLLKEVKSALDTAS